MANEMRLIDSYKFEKLLIDHRTDCLFKEDVIAALAKAPTVDAVEVVHGRWIDRIDNDTQMYECSVCGARVVKGLYEYDNPNRYCYHCGAKMDGERRTDGKG